MELPLHGVQDITLGALASIQICALNSTDSGWPFGTNHTAQFGRVAPKDHAPSSVGINRLPSRIRVNQGANLFAQHRESFAGSEAIASSLLVALSEGPNFPVCCAALSKAWS